MAKNLYPVLTPLRNRIPRSTKGSGAGNAVNWKAVNSITGSGVKSMGWVPEGQRAGRMTISTQDVSATYVTLGEEADVTFEAQSAGQGFEDVMATTGMRLLQSMMIKEEYAIMGGNRSVALGIPTAPTTGTATTGGLIAAATYNVAVVALTAEGYLAADLVNGVFQAVTVTGLDNQTFVLNGGSSNKSVTTAQITTGATSTITATTPTIKGAVAYAWYAGLAGAERLQAITTLNSVVLVNALPGTGQLLTAITIDASRNATLAYDGLLSAVFNSSTAYYKAFATGVAGTGTVLTSNGNGGVVEIDTALRAFWDNYRLSPEEMYVNAQELNSIAKIVLSGTGTPLARFMFDVNMKNPQLVAGATVGWYFNKFSMDGGQLIPIKLHPFMPAGTIFMWAQNLPAQYQSANVPNTAEIQCRRDYYQIPLTEWLGDTVGNDR